MKNPRIRKRKRERMKRMGNLILSVVGLLLLGFSIPSWLYSFKVFKIMYEGISAGNTDALVVRIAITILGFMLLYLGINRAATTKYISISRKDEMNIEVSKKVVLDVVKDIANQFSESLILKSTDLNEENENLRMNMIVELKDTTKINELVENLMNTVKNELRDRIGISDVKITVGVEKLAIHG